MEDRISIEIIMGFEYTKEEAINILKGLNPDGSKYVELPF